MKIRLLVLVTLGAFALPVYAQPACRIVLPESRYSDVLKEILSRSVVDAKEFEAVTFASSQKVADADLIVKRNETDFTVTPRHKFTGEFPATWMNVERLNAQLTIEVLDHLETLRREKKRSAQDVADIFIGSLNWKRLEEKKPSLPEPEPRPSETSATTPQIKLWKLLTEQLFFIFLPMVTGLLFGLPFGRSFYKNEWAKNFFLSLTGIFTTIPPIALLCFFIPSYGMGRVAALVTTTLFDILLIMKYSADIPEKLSSRFVSKMKRVVILNVNLSTLAAFLGVGGFGSLISLGLALNDVPMMLRGTLGVAFLAMTLKWLLEAWEFVLAKQGR